MSSPPLIYLALAFSVGIVLPVEGPSLLAPLLGAALLALAAASRRSRWPLPLAVCAYILLGMSAGGLERGIETTLADVYDRLGEKQFQLPCYATGRLRREPENLPHVSLLRVDVDSLVVGRRSMNVVGGLIVAVRGNRRQRLERLTAGDRVGFWGSVRLPSGFNNPGGADATRRLERGRIDAFASVKSALLVEVLERAPLAFSLASRLRQQALRRLELALTRGGAPEEGEHRKRSTPCYRLSSRGIAASSSRSSSVAFKEPECFMSWRSAERTLPCSSSFCTLSCAGSVSTKCHRCFFFSPCSLSTRSFAAPARPWYGRC